MEAKGLELKKIAAQLVHVHDAIDATMRAHAAGVEIEAPEELEDVKADLLAEVRDRLVDVFVDLKLKLETVQLRGTPEPLEQLGDTTEAIFRSVLRAADVDDQRAADLVIDAMRAEVKSGEWQIHVAAVRQQRQLVAGAEIARPIGRRVPLTDSELEILEHALELLAFDRPADVKAAVARVGEKLTALLAPAPADVERIDFFEVDLKVAVSALAAYRAPWKGGADDEQRAVLDRLGVKLASHLAQLQHRAALAKPSAPPPRPSPASLAQVAEAVADPSIPVPGVTPCAGGQHFTDVGAYQCRCGELKYDKPFMVTMLRDGSIVS